MSQIGDEFTISKTFSVGGVATDPTTIQVIHRTPDLTETVYTYPDDTEITRSSAGVYVFTLVLSEARTHVFRWVGTGAVDDSSEVTEVVDESYFVEPMP